MNIVALIQARMGSTRLPCKMMLSLHGLPLIDWVVRRTAASRLLNRIIVATSEAPANDPLAAHLEGQGTEVFRGPEDDVLKRFRLAAEQAGATHVVRICADNSLVELDRCYGVKGADLMFDLTQDWGPDAIYRNLRNVSRCMDNLFVRVDTENETPTDAAYKYADPIFLRPLMRTQSLSRSLRRTLD